MDDGSANPAELTIDKSTGIFTLKKIPSRKKSYTVSIKIVTIGQGENDPELTVSGVKVTTICGPDSTIITAPTLTDYTKTTKIKRLPDYSNTAQFISSNKACDIVKTEMIEGNANFEFALTG